MPDYIQTYLTNYGIPGWKPLFEVADKPLGHRVTNAPPWLNAITHFVPDPYVHTHSTLTASRALSNGVKIFRLSQAEADTLAICDADIRAADYVQPFSTMFYAMPDAFQTGTDEVGEGLWPFVAVDWLAPGRLVVTGFIARPPYSGSSPISTTFHLYPDNERSVADNIGNTLDPKTASVIHVALNAGLYLSLRGTTERHADPSRVKGLKRRKRERPHLWRDIQRQLKKEPMLVEPVRRIVVRPSSISAHEGGLPTGMRQRPHERRGHFRMQACGPRWLDHKLVFIEPYTVGGRRDFGGTHTEYTLAH